MYNEAIFAPSEAENIRRGHGILRSYDAIDGFVWGIWCPLQDQKGYLWLGNNEGLHRYDGVQLVSYTTQDGLVDNCVLAVCEDHQGKLWIGTRAGLSCFDGGYFTNYNSSDGLVGNSVDAIYEDHSGQLWFGTRDSGVFCFDGERFTNYTTSDGLADVYIQAICEDHGRELWFGTKDRGISCFDGKHFSNYTTDDGLVDNRIRTICKDCHGRLWIGTGNGVSCFDGEHFTNYTTEDGLASNNIQGICEDSQGQLWFATYGGVSCFDGQQFVNYTTRHGLLDNRVSGVIQDREGILWFSHNFSGLICFDSQTLQHITTEPVTEALVVDPQGRLWFGNENKLFCFFADGQYCRTFDEDIFSILRDSGGRLWVGTLGNGLYFYDSTDAVWNTAGRQFIGEDGLQGNSVLSLLEAKDGTIWAGTAKPGYLCRFHESSHFGKDNHKFSPFGKGGQGDLESKVGASLESALTAIPTPHPAILRLLEDSRGRIWMAGGNDGAGISCYDGQQFVTYTTRNGLPDDSVYSIVEDDAGHLWIGTQGGLCRFDGKRFTYYGKEQGILSPNHQCSAKDVSGQLWFGTFRGGIYRTDGEHFQMLTTEDGLPSNNISGLLPRPDGSMIIGTHRGIVQYRPTAITPPLIEIREVIASHVYPNPEELELTTAEASLLIISYHGLSFATRRMRYSYILEGYDEEWQDTWDNQVRYENLPVGEYTFKVIAINRELVYSESPAELKIIVIPTHWKQLRVEYDTDADQMQRLIQLNERVIGQDTLSDTALAIVEGLRELGFDRVAVFIRDIGDKYVHGLWATGYEGNVYRNGEQLYPADSIPPNDGYYVVVDRPVSKAKSGSESRTCCQLVSYGSGIFLARNRDEGIFESIWGYPPPCSGYYRRGKNGDNISLCVTAGDEKIGIIAVDNYITKRMIDETWARLFSLVGTQMAKLLADAALRESLAQSEAKSKAILDAIPDLMFRISRDGVFLDYRAVGDNGLYVPGSEIIGSNVRDILPSEIADLVIHYVRKTLESGTIQIYEYQLPMPQGIRDYESRMVVGGEDEVLAIVRDITERKLAERREKEYIRHLTFLSRTAIEFVILPLEDDIYQFIGERLKELVGNSIIVISAFESSSDSSYCRAVLGMGKYTRPVLKLLGRDPVGMSFKAGYEVKIRQTKAKLVRLSGDLHELSLGQISKSVGHKLEKLLGLGDIYSIGFATEGDLFGAAYICMRGGTELGNQDIIETFINRASVALRRRQAEEQIKASLLEKEVLLKEIHHRVKNNLQIISSLLNLQSGYIGDEQVSQMFKESQNRVRSMALIHEKLYQSENLARIDFAEYVRDLTNYLFRMYGASSYGIKLEINADDVSLDIDMAIPCGLIVNELVSNSLKYAFPIEPRQSESKGTIRIGLNSDNNGKLTLIVSDNGIGLPEGLDYRKTGSLGLQLVNTLANQLEGDMELDRNGGTTFKITFGHRT